MAETGMIADIAAVTDNNRGYAYPMMMYPPYGMGNGFGNNGFGGDWIGLILLALLFGGGFGGFGGYGGAGGAGLGGGLLGYALGNNATKTDLSDGLTSLQTSNKIDNVSTQLCNGFNTVNNELLSGFGNSNLAACQNTASIVSAIDNSRFAQQQCCCDIKSEIAQSRFAQQQCCCDLQTAIVNSDNLNFRNTCDLKELIREQGEATRALIVTNEMTELREKLAAERQKVQDARFDASQIAQTANIVNQLQPVAKPAYITCSPYQSAVLGLGSLGCGGWSWGSQFIS